MIRRCLLPGFGQTYFSLVSVLVFILTAGCSSGGGGSNNPTTGNTTSTLTDEQCLEILEAAVDLSAVPDECLHLVPETENTVEGKIFAIGTQIDGSGNLVIYANGTDTDGVPLTVSDLQQAQIEVKDASGAVIGTFSNGGPELIIEPVAAGDAILSLAFVTDYSTSVSDSDLNGISDVYQVIIDNLPSVYEAQVINFSNTALVQLPDWAVVGDDPDPDPDIQDIVGAIQVDTSIVRGGTALYDAIGMALKGQVAGDESGSVPGDGLIERCRPAHMLVVFTDGLENASSTYDKTQLVSLIEDSETVAIMVGARTADLDVLTELAGDQGAVVYAFDTNGITAEVNSWTESLQYVVKFTLTPNPLPAGNSVSIVLGTQTTDVARPTDALCEAP